ncbi:MAG: hypothetical protein ACTJHW_14855 [Paenalcaligenes sp.]
MKKSIILISVILAGCAFGNYSWQKPGGTPSEREAAISDCEYDVLKYGSDYSYKDSDDVRSKAITRNQDLRHACMKQKGWSFMPIQ